MLRQKGGKYEQNPNQKPSNQLYHSIVFVADDGEEVEVPASGITLAAESVERSAGHRNGVQFVKTVYRPGGPGAQEYADLQKTYGHHLDKEGTIVVGSIISAQAYPGVCCLVPMPGHDRKPPSERRYRSDKFSIYADPVAYRSLD